MNGVLTTVKVKKPDYQVHDSNQKDDVPEKVPLLAQLVYGSYSENKSKLILLHDHGVGSPCGKCEKCEGLELHYWRKVCKNCGCKLEDHDVKINTKVHEAIVYNLLHMTDNLSPVEIDSDDDEQLRAHPMLKEFCKKNKKRGERDGEQQRKESKNSENRSVSLTINTAGNMKITRDENNNQSQDHAEDELRQQEISQRQIPLQDFDPKFCHDLDQFERKELKYFRNQVQEDAIGKAIEKNKHFKDEPKCFDCKQIINSGSQFLTVERIPAHYWHPECLKCFYCKELLAGNIYFAHDQKVYCGRHYGELFKSRCAACDELIFAKTYTNAEEVNWHTKHFCCFKCDVPLGDKLYVMISMQPHCVPCYHDNIADRCVACKKPIKAGTERLTFDDINWHVNEKCFSCAMCKKSLIELPFLVCKEKVFCSQECLGD